LKSVECLSLQLSGLSHHQRNINPMLSEPIRIYTVDTNILLEHHSVSTMKSSKVVVSCHRATLESES